MRQANRRREEQENLIPEAERLLKDQQRAFQHREQQARTEFLRELQVLRASIVSLQQAQNQQLQRADLQHKAELEQVKHAFEERLHALKEQLKEQLRGNEELETTVKRVRMDTAQKEQQLRQRDLKVLQLIQTFNSERELVRSEIFRLNSEKDDIINELNRILEQKLTQHARTVGKLEEQINRMQVLLNDKTAQVGQLEHLIRKEEEKLRAKEEYLSKMEEKAVLLASDLDFLSKQTEQWQHQKELEISAILKDVEDKERRVKALEREVTDKRREIGELLTVGEQAKARYGELLNDKAKQNSLLKESLISSEADHRTAKSLLEKVKRDFENEHKRNLDLGVELKERQSKIEATQKRVRVLEELVESEQQRIRLLGEQLEQHEKGFVKELLQIQLQKYIDKFQKEIRSLEVAQMDERERMKKLMEFQLDDQAAIQDRKSRLYEEEIAALQARLEEAYRQLHQQRISR